MNNIIEHFQLGIYFGQSEIANLEELVSNLEPIQESIIYLSRNKVNPIEGLTTFMYLEKSNHQKLTDFKRIFSSYKELVGEKYNYFFKIIFIF